MEDLQVSESNKLTRAAHQFANDTRGHHMTLSFRLSRLNCGCEQAKLMPEFSASERKAHPWWIAQHAGQKRCQVPVLIPSGRARRREKQTALGQQPFSLLSGLLSFPFSAGQTWRNSCTSSWSSSQVRKHTWPWVMITGRVKNWCKNSILRVMTSIRQRLQQTARLHRPWDAAAPSECKGTFTVACSSLEKTEQSFAMDSFTTCLHIARCNTVQAGGTWSFAVHSAPCSSSLVILEGCQTLSSKFALYP